ncbi:ABC transporter substrate-binding protein [Microbacterium sp. YY-01]|uniref:ABC transporter substrate-binding protein n=1 Tax=Microbacterium sp. YY-01 TaxID=3421634 RepID=UPI003D1821C7
MKNSRSRRPLIRAAIAITAGALVLSGCSANNSGGGAEGEVTELIIPTNVSPWLDSYKKIAAEYERETGIKITLKEYPFDGLRTQQINDVRNQSHTFDLYQIAEADTGRFYEDGWVQKLTDVDENFTWPENVISFAGIGEWNADKRLTEEGGTPYALPIMGIVQEFMYRTDVYDKLGLDVPTTWDEVIANGKAAMDAGEVDYGYVVRLKGESFDFTTYLHAMGGDWYTEDWEPALDTPEAKKALELFTELTELGPDAPQTMGQAEATAVMQGGTALQGNLVSSVATALEDENESSVVGKIGYALMPGQTPHSGAWALGIPAGLPEARTQAAYDFLTWITGKEAQQAWTEFGGVPVRTDIESDNPAIEQLKESSEHLLAPPRFPFATQMYETTDRVIAEAVTGQISHDEALATMQEELRRLAIEAGYLQE